MGLRRVVKHADAGGGGDERTQENNKGIKCRRKDKEGICRKNAAANMRRRPWGAWGKKAQGARRNTDMGACEKGGT